MGRCEKKKNWDMSYFTSKKKMRYEKIKWEFEKQDSEFLSAAIPKLKEELSVAFASGNEGMKRLIKKQLNAVKEILTSRH